MTFSRESREHTTTAHHPPPIDLPLTTPLALRALQSSPCHNTSSLQSAKMCEALLASSYRLLVLIISFVSPDNCSSWHSLARSNTTRSIDNLGRLQHLQISSNIWSKDAILHLSLHNNTQLHAVASPTLPNLLRWPSNLAPEFPFWRIPRQHAIFSAWPARPLRW